MNDDYKGADAADAPEAAPPSVEDQLRLMLERRIMFGYTNHKGEFAIRHVVPMAIAYEKTPWHEERQWIMHAYDTDRKAMRGFALAQADFTIMEAAPDAPAANETMELHKAVSNAIFGTYIGVSASHVKADKAATAALEQVQAFYERMAGEQEPQA